MAWHSPRTWASGEFWTAALVNEQLRDNMIALTPVLGEYAMFTRQPSATETVIGTNWLECNGVAVSRANYDDLYTLLDGMRVPRGSGTTTLTAAMDSVTTTLSMDFWNHTWPGGRENWFTAFYNGPEITPFLVQVDSEKMLVTSKGAWDYKNITVVRAREGTLAASHNLGATVTLAPDMPFGSGDGVTTFNLPDLHGRSPWAAARSGGHIDVAFIGLDDRAALAARRPKHRHAWSTNSAGSPGTQVSWSSGTLGSGVFGWGSHAGTYPYNNYGMFVGPLDEGGLASGGNSYLGTAVDAPGYVVTGVWGIRFVA